MKDKDMESLKKIMSSIKSAGTDAVIVSDLGALHVARENGINVHMSVQANISNMEALKFLKEAGVSRVILSRELGLDEIKQIKAKSPVEVEVFVHGAMCLAVSGRCFLSSYLYDKGANCGECVQPCRRDWKLVSGDLKELELDCDTEILEKELVIHQYEGQGHILSPKDLCMIDHVPELIEAGIDAFKIEGRARPADYVATVTKAYREAIGSYESGNWKFDEKWLNELKKVFNRGFDTGFYFKTPYKTSEYNKATHLKKDIGIVSNYYSRVSAAELKLHDDLELGDEIIITGPTTGSTIQNVESMQINGKNVNKALKGESVAILFKTKVRPNDIVYKRISRNQL